MRKFMVIFVCLLAWPVLAGAAEEKPAPVTVEGRLIDLSCYTMGMTGEKHATCAAQCAEKGLPVGLLEVKTGKVYTVILPAPGLAVHTEKTVRVEGMVHSGSLLAPTGMKVKDGSAWKAVVLPKAM